MNHHSSRRDAIGVAMAVVLVALVASRVELNEQIYGFTRRLEPWQIDELPFVLLTLSIGLIWYALRRQREVRHEASARIVAEERLQQALLDLRRLGRERVVSQEEERKAIARDLHDELGQYLTALKLDASLLSDQLSDGPARERASGLIAAIQRLHEVVRDLISRLRPVGLDELGLTAALEHCVDQWQLHAPACTLLLDQEEGLDELDEASSLTVYRIVQEGVTNALRHAQATQIQISVQRTSSARGAEVRIVVEDDGRGCPGGPLPGFGLRGMRERIETADGKLQFRTADRGGLILEARLPVRTVR